MTPRLALILGDPAGIGPEIMSKLLAEEANRDRAALLLVGDGAELEEGMRIAGARFEMARVNDPAAARPGRVARASTSRAAASRASARCRRPSTWPAPWGRAGAWRDGDQARRGHHAPDHPPRCARPGSRAGHPVPRRDSALRCSSSRACG